MASAPRSRFYDPLYGEIGFSKAIGELLESPLVQRLRHVRLSNIDSTSLPGIAGITRFEHVLGTAWLATRAAFTKTLDREEFQVVVAAALLHDAAITPFGHLVEESLQYVGRY